MSLTFGVGTAAADMDPRLVEGEAVVVAGIVASASAGRMADVLQRRCASAFLSSLFPSVGSRFTGLKNISHSLFSSDTTFFTGLA